MKKGWEVKKLGELCTIKGRIGYRGYTKEDLVSKGEGAISLSPSNILGKDFILDNCTYISWFKYDESPEIKIFNGDIIFVKTGSSFGKSALVEELPEKATINPQLVVFKNINCINKYLYYAVNSVAFKAQVNKIIAGTAIPTLSQANLAELLISVPSKSEQQLIVSVLDEAFASIAQAKSNAERNLVNARELFEAVLQSLVSNDQWEKKTLKEISITFGRGKSKNRPRGDPKLYGGKYPFIQTGDISNSNHWITTYSQTYNELGLAQSKLWTKGTICIAIVGANVGETAILGFDACFPDSVIGIVVNDKTTSNEYVEYLLQTFKTAFKIMGKGTARDNINMGMFENQKFPFPPLVEQRAIVGRLEALSAETGRLEEIYRQKIESLEALKKSVLAKAFEGEL